MNTSLKLAAIALASAQALFAADAFACTYYIDELAQTNELTAAAATSLRAALTDVEQSSIETFRWFESISTPMCPKELTFEGTFELTYADVTALVPTVCDATVAVTKVANWETGLETYTPTTVAGPDCRAR